MPRTELQTTSFDPDELKKSFIDYLKTTNEFGDFDYEGSAINTIVDLLTYNTTYNAFLANMLANESFLDSAQLRESVVSHAQKLSYRPKSKTASRLFCNIEVKPSSYPESKVITMPKGLSFFKSIGNDTYTFTNSQRYTLTYDDSSELYKSGNVELIQGQFISDEVEYNGDPITIENGSIDMSTLMVSVIEGADSVSYSESTDIADIGNDRAVFFTRELPGPRFQISFGGDVIGNEPLVNSKVKIEYISCENIEGNKVESLIAGSSIDGYSNIKINVTQPSFWWL